MVFKRRMVGKINMSFVHQMQLLIRRDIMYATKLCLRTL